MICLPVSVLTTDAAIALAVAQGGFRLQKQLYEMKNRVLPEIFTSRYTQSSTVHFPDFIF